MSSKIDQQQFENLCGFQCTGQEICDWFRCTEKELDEWCSKTYRDFKTENGKKITGFEDAFLVFRGRGKISLRRAQWQLASKSPQMAIFLGKQYLGQNDDFGDDFD